MSEILNTIEVSPVTIFEMSTIAIALLSLSISLFIILRDRRDRRIKLLILCYSRLVDEHNKRPPIPLSSRIDAEEEDEDLEQVVIKEHEKSVFFNLERELNTTCYLFIKRQLPKHMFYDLFGQWLKGRYAMWPSVEKHKIGNFRFTWKVIQYYKKKGYFRKGCKRVFEKDIACRKELAN